LARKWLLTNYPSQFEKENNNAPAFIRYPNETSIFEQFKNKMKGKHIKSLFLTAPFLMLI